MTGPEKRGTSGLFSLGPGKTAPTQAPPSERFPLLEEALYSLSPRRREVALKACEAALEKSHFTRVVGPERRGLVELDLWKPKTYSEWFSAFRHCWVVLRGCLSRVEGDEKAAVAKVLLNKANSMLEIQSMESVVLDTLEELVREGALPDKDLLEGVLSLIKHGPESAKARLSDIEKQIIGGENFGARLRRHVILPPWEIYNETRKGGPDPFEAIAREVLEDSAQLQSELEWLSTGKAESAHLLGYRLGLVDAGNLWLGPIGKALITAGPEGSTRLLGGYLRAVQERQPEVALATLREMAGEQSTRGFVVPLVYDCGLSDDSARIILDLIREGIEPAESLAKFIYGAQVRGLSQAVFEEWIQFLIEVGTQIAGIAALDLCHSFVGIQASERRQLSLELLEDVLLNETVFEPIQRELRGAHADYDWAELAKLFIEARSDKRLQFAQKLLESMGEDSVVMNRFGNRGGGHQVLNRIAKAEPDAVWAMAAPLLGPPIDSRAYTIREWLKGGDGPFSEDQSDSLLNDVPVENLWRWVDQDVENRAWYLANIVPKELFRSTEKRCLPREVLIRYGDREDVRNNLSSNFFTGGWHGPASQHYTGKRKMLADFLANEENPRVRQWLTEMIASLDEWVVRERMREEREF